MDSGQRNAEVALDPLFLQRRKLYERSRAVKVEIDKGKAEVTSSSSEFGESSEQISVEYSGAALTISFSGHWVLDYTLPGLRDRALLHESSLARTMPTDRILTYRCDTTLVGRGRSSD